VLRGGALPLRAVRHDRVRHLRRHLLLVPEDDRPDDGRAPRQVPLLGHVHRLPPDVPGAALAGHPGHAAPLRRVRRDRRVHDAEHDLDDRRVHPRRLDAAVPVERVPQLPLRAARRGRRPVGPRQLAGVGDVLPAAAAQLHRTAAHPFRAPGVRAALPPHRGADAPGGARRVPGREHGRGRRGADGPGGDLRGRPPQPL
ncbi:MAG: Cytochrome c oxidase polypeptide I, partial [uncultured Actinomycetospora sp.]